MTDHTKVASPARTVCYADGSDLDASRGFYTDVLGLDPTMEDPVLGLTSPTNPSAQVLIPPAGFEHPQPRFGVDLGHPGAVDAAHAAALDRGLRIVYPLTDEAWGVRRFFVEDPGGTIVNVLAHTTGISAETPGVGVGVRRVSPRLVVPDAEHASAYYQRTLGTEQLHRGLDQAGRPVAVIHRLGESTFTVSPAVADWGWHAPGDLGGTPVLIEIECADPDDLAHRMVDGGAEIVVPIENRPYGKREGRVRDPFGHLWILTGDPA
jgi:uncharacterized glyoxalase superfamily protein PhnB